jgi:radical SAM superfamily enzyme YgiQ (UPF0313 family)
MESPLSCPAVALVGSEFEENLSIRYLAAAVRGAGFRPRIVATHAVNDPQSLVRDMLSRDPIVIGLSMPFQMYAVEIMDLARLLRERGFAGHITVGGHFATFEYENILREAPAIDSVVRHEGEIPFTMLCEAVQDGKEVAGIPGIIVRDNSGVVVGEAHHPPKLDALPFPVRSGKPHDVLGVPCSPIVGSRGCYADCSFCCIYAYAQTARAPRYRMRTPENIVAEMVEERRGRGVRLFVFHDDNFFLPTPHMNLKRYRRMAECLRAAGLDDIALVIKCRPNDVQPELFQLLKSMGMIRAYVGIETNSDEGIVSLNRRITSEDNRNALNLLRELDIYCSFNVLIFDPEATMDGVQRNLDFMQEFAEVPSNFCRAEVYAGTPLKHTLEAEGRLEGNYLAWNYRMRDTRVELLFRIASTMFMSRNFNSDGVNNLNMGVRFDNEVMRFFYPGAWDRAWHVRLVTLSRDIVSDSVHRMREAHAFVTRIDPSDRHAIHEFALAGARQVARADLTFIARIQEARREMERRIGVQGVRNRRVKTMPAWAAETARLGASSGTGFSTEVLPAPAGVGREER